MPVVHTPADSFCLALYTLAGGHILRGFMLTTVADRLGISFRQAEAMAIAAAKTGLVKMESGTINLTADGWTLGETLTAPAFETSAVSTPAVPSTQPAKARPRRRR
jgi:hypothetical protein